MIIYKSIEIKWMITGYSNYGFGTDKSLYNLKTGRKLNQSYNNGFGVYVGYFVQLLANALINGFQK